MNPLIQGRSGTAPETSRNALSTSQGTNEDDSPNDAHPEAGIFHNQMTQNSGPEEGNDKSSDLSAWNPNFTRKYLVTEDSNGPYMDPELLYTPKLDKGLPVFAFASFFYE